VHAVAVATDILDITISLNTVSEEAEEAEAEEEEEAEEENARIVLNYSRDPCSRRVHDRSAAEAKKRERVRKRERGL